MVVKRLVILVIVICATRFGASAGALDSLKTLAANEKDPGRKLELLNSISKIAAEGNFDVAKKEIETQYNYARHIGDSKGVVKSLLLMSKIYINTQNVDSSLKLSEKALFLARAIKDSNMIARAYLLKGDAFHELNDLSGALEFYNKSYFINYQLKDYKGLFENLNRLSKIYYEQNRFDEAFQKDKEALAIAQRLNYPDLQALAYGSIGNILYIKKEYDSALTNYNRALEYYSKYGGIKTAVLYSNIGDVYVEKRQFNTALDYFNKARSIAENTANFDVLAHLYITIGRCYLLRKDYTDAEVYLHKGEEMVKSSDDYELTAEVYGLLSDLYAAQYDYKTALDYQLKVEQTKDLLYKQTTDIRVLELQTRFETLKKERENALLRVENEIATTKLQRQRFSIIALSVTVALALIMGVMIFYLLKYRSRKLKTEQALNSQLELQNLNVERLNNMLEIRAIRAQMDPHFIFNCLASIQHLITTGRTEEAERYIAKFSKLMRMVLENAEKNSVSLDKELEMLNLYLELESIRMSENFTYEINVDESLRDENIKVPTLLIQPFAENAIRHGLASKKDNRKLMINIETANNMLLCTIEDNGIGRANSAALNNRKDHQSKAVKMINERLNIIRQQTRVKSTGIETIDLYDTNQQPAGTRVVIQLPISSRA